MTALWIYPLLALAGFAAGFINTLAGAGSVISLAVLDLAGLPVGAANGTNRVAILLQTALAAGRFKKQGKLSVRPHLGIILPAIAGGVLGALLAGQVSGPVLRRSIGVCMALTLIPLFMRPARWLQGSAERETRPAGPLKMISFFLIGIYGGYVQLGVGVFLLTALVLAAGLDLVRGNAVKLLIAFCYTVPALAVFAANGLVRWDLGLVLAAGNMLGAWTATHEAARRGAPFIRRLLIAVVMVASVRYLFF
jgi:uncharacterized protein